MKAEPENTMVLIEPDKDLAECVTGFFSDRFEVNHVATLEDASKVLQMKAARFLFANIDTPSQKQASVIEQIHGDYPQMKIIVSYLSPTTGEPWEKKFSACVDVFVRKPYRVAEVDKALRALDEKKRSQR
jgi:DNA-binding NtrC family response regulator